MRGLVKRWLLKSAITKQGVNKEDTEAGEEVFRIEEKDGFWENC